MRTSFRARWAREILSGSSPSPSLEPGPLRIFVLLAAFVLAGCVEPPVEPTETLADYAPAESPSLAVEPTVVAWSGRVLSSTGEGFLHMRPTEDVLWPLEQEGILFDLTEAPQELEVALSWEGPGEFMIMLHSHKEHGSNAYVEHITKLDAENPKCLRVPAADIVAGEWQVMVHSRGAQMTTFTLEIVTVGGAGHVVEDDRHGHWLQDGAFDVEEHEIEPCMHHAGHGSEPKR